MRSPRLRSTVLSVAAVTLTVAGAMPAAAGGGTVHWVDDDGKAGTTSCDSQRAAFETVGAAEDAAVSGDTIRVCPGVYRESVVVDTPRITIEGVQPHWGAVLRPSTVTAARRSPANGLASVIQVRANGVLLRWLKIVVPSKNCAPNHYGILAESVKGLRIRGNRILNQPSPWSWDCGLATGIRAIDSKVLIGWNIIRDATQNGIRLDQSSGTVFRNSIHYRHAKGSPCPTAACSGTAGVGGIITLGVGIDVNQGSDATVQRNHIESDPTSQWVWADGIDLAGATATIDGNTIVRVDTGIDIANGQGLIKDNVIRDGGQDGIFADASEPAAGLLLEITGNRVTGFSGNGIDMRQPDDGGLDVHDNDFSGNDSLDCVDGTLPSSGNTWTNNTGDDANPPDICDPAP